MQNSRVIRKFERAFLKVSESPRLEKMIEQNAEMNQTWQLIGTPYRPPKYYLMQRTVLGDTLNISHNKSVFSGVVTLINIKGVGVHTDDGYKFIKWCNVISKEVQ